MVVLIKIRSKGIYKASVTERLNSAEHENYLDYAVMLTYGPLYFDVNDAGMYVKHPILPHSHGMGFLDQH